MSPLAVLLLIGIVILIKWRVGAVAVSDRDLAWFTSGQPCPPDETALYVRYLERHRRHRLGGGIFGLVFAIAVGLRWYGVVNIGIGEGSPLGDMLFCGLAGVVVGTLSAESFRLSEPASSNIAASLAARDEFVQPDVRRIARGAILGAVIVGLLVAVSGNGYVPLLIALGGAATTAVAEWTQAAITRRRRPVLSDRAKAADLRMRSFASTSVATLQLAMSVLVAGWTISKIPTIDNGAIGMLKLLAVVGCLVAAVILLRRAAPRPPRGWTLETAP